MKNAERRVKNIKIAIEASRSRILRVRRKLKAGQFGTLIRELMVVKSAVRAIDTRGVKGADLKAINAALKSIETMWEAAYSELIDQVTPPSLLPK